jgi:hypothetical protein
LDIGGTKLANDIELLPKRLKTLYFYRDKLDLYKELKDYCEHNPYGAYKCDYQT